MNGDDRPCPICDFRLDAVGVDVVHPGVNIDKHRLHIVMQYNITRRHKCYRRDNYLVPILPSVSVFQSRKGQVKGGCSAATEDCKPAVMKRGETFLESLGKGSV